ncbi:oxidoreductase, 2OG-Fe(II) oxygenase family protein [Lysobacter enzymogenes]|uniref:Oxidoreductase, 2OG-Fe(II) oxygenase family protein n=1 Tax=Lysobacter enzymogenes TaxID=69 RepID=A0A0S2DGA0_LYSEN|nr:2OG-Fe(II) oxygenase [Lysobacter enzymogenes]ALN57327.1 oxidoreductase, 2OG-Fe(II) oxygenase family protein [Lysobacter enzymogenes]
MTDDSELAGLRRNAEGGAAPDLYRWASALLRRGAAEPARAAYARAAAQGLAEARIEFARMAMHGIGGDTDLSAAHAALDQAERAGSAVAGYFIALMAVGRGDFAAAEHDRRLLAAVRAEYPPALRAAALLFGRRHDDEAAQNACLQLLERAAAHGDAIAARLLAERLLRGEGCAPQPQAAAELIGQLRAHGARIELPPIAVGAPAQRDAAPADAVSLADAAQPVALAPLSAHPRVGQVDALLSADECRLLVAQAQPSLRPSQTVDERSGRAVPNPLRDSSDASLDPAGEDLALRLAQWRMARAAGLDLVHGEHLTVLRYAPGQAYRPHRDYLSPQAQARDRPQAGDRLRTVCVYLNAVEAGGATEFPHAALAVTPQAGRALVFDNLDADGRPEPASLHAGTPVLAGEKWLATLWLRERPYRAF